MESQKQSSSKILLFCGIFGPLSFIITFLIEGAFRENYSAMLHPVSSLSIGDMGWMQITNFIITGSCILLFSLGLRKSFRLNEISTKGVLPIALVGAGLLGAGIFSTDAVYGYPMDKPLAIAQYTIHGHLHDLFSIIVFISLPVACFSFRKRFIDSKERSLANYSLFTSIAMIITFILAGVGFKQAPGFVEMAGLLQRSSIIIGWVWICVLALHFLKLAKSE